MIYHREATWAKFGINFYPKQLKNYKNVIKNANKMTKMYIYVIKTWIIITYQGKMFNLG